MADILAFGDSLTWGRTPEAAARHAPADRWPEALAAGLTGARVVTEAMRGRLTAFDQSTAPADANGARMLPVLLHSHAPLDLIIVMLGTNDLYYGLPPHRVGDGLARIVEVVRGHAWRLDHAPTPQILLMAPPPMVPCAGDPVITPKVIARSQDLVGVVRALAAESGSHFFDASAVVQASAVDGIHMDGPMTRKLGEALRAPVARILAGRGA